MIPEDTEDIPVLQVRKLEQNKGCFHSHATELRAPLLHSLFWKQSYIKGSILTWHKGPRHQYYIIQLRFKHWALTLTSSLFLPIPRADRKRAFGREKWADAHHRDKNQVPFSLGVPCASAPDGGVDWSSFWTPPQMLLMRQIRKKRKAKQIRFSGVLGCWLTGGDGCVNLAKE